MNTFLIILSLLIAVIACVFTVVSLDKAQLAWKERKTRKPGQPHYWNYFILAVWGAIVGMFSITIIGSRVLLLL